MKNLVKNLQLLLLGIILFSTVIAVVLEIRTMFINQTVTLADLLLMFLYLEVMAMVRVFWEEQSISISLPLLPVRLCTFHHSFYVFHSFFIRSMSNVEIITK